jgi:hypothetical protein
MTKRSSKNSDIGRYLASIPGPPPTIPEKIGTLTSSKFRDVTVEMRKLLGAGAKGLSDVELILRSCEGEAHKILRKHGYVLNRNFDIRRLFLTPPKNISRRLELWSAVNVILSVPPIREAIAINDAEKIFFETIRFTVAAVWSKNISNILLGVGTRTGQRVRGRQRGTQISEKRKPEHERWRSAAEGEKENIRAKNPRKKPSKIELARKVKAKLRLSESVHTIRQQL